MTKEEAIKILKECRESKLKYTFITLNEYQSATDMAIQALEQQPCEDAISRQAEIDLDELRHRFGDEVAFVVEDMMKGTNERWSCSENPNRCGDLISREETLTAFADYVGSGMSMNDYDALWDIVAKMPSVKTQEPCKDTISRQAVLEGLASIAKAKAKSDAQKSLMGRIMFFVEQLPSVSTEKTGQWIAQDIHNCHTDFKCSECGYIHSFMHLYGEPTADYTYCPNCGARMREVEE